MSTIYLLIGGVDYEGSRAIRAYVSKDECEAAVKACTDYHETFPTWPDDTSDESVQDYSELRDQWRAGHPAGENEASNDYFCIQEVELVEPRHDRQAKS